MLGTCQGAFLGGESVLFALAGMEDGTVVAWVSTNGPVQAWNRTEDQATCYKFPFASPPKLGA